MDHSARRYPKVGSIRQRQQLFLAALFLAPATLMLGMFMALPIANAVLLSFSSWDGVTAARWIGLQNYEHLLYDPVFRSALQNTVSFTVVTTLFHVTIPLVIATVLNAKLPGSMMFRTIYLIPFVVSGAISGVLWGMILEPNFGVLNHTLRALHLSNFAHSWLAEQATVMPSIIVVSLWKSFGFYTLIFFAGLQGIPKHFYEAALIDGATVWQQFRYITAPALRTVITVVAVLSTVEGLQVFDHVWVMTGGGPNHYSETLGTYLYGIAFGNRAISQLGYAGSIGVVILGLCLVTSIIQIRLGRRAEFEY